MPRPTRTADLAVLPATRPPRLLGTVVAPPGWRGPTGRQGPTGKQIPPTWPVPTAKPVPEPTASVAGQAPAAGGARSARRAGRGGGELRPLPALSRGRPRSS